jgi:phosphatidate cytidylyltransferase
MPDEGDERGSGFDDLFEDLDKFFAPEEGSRERRPPAEAAKDEAQAETGAHQEESEVEDELLPSDWLPDVEGLELDEPEPAEPVREARSSVPLEPPPFEPPATEDVMPDTTTERPEWAESRPASSAPDRGPEMSPQDWSRLREVLGEETAEGEQDEMGFVPDPGRTSAEGLFGYGDIEGEELEDERRELTLDDLKKAPPEYRNLPGPDDEAFHDERDAMREGRGTFLGEREGLRDDFADLGERPSVPEQTDDAWPAAGETGAPASGARRDQGGADEALGEPGIAEVEAAADQMAEEFRTGLPPEEELLADLRRPTAPRTVKVGQPETMTGPTWEEPGSQALMGDTAAPVFAGRNMPMALLTAAVLAAAALISLAISRAAFAVVVGGIVLIGQAEVYAAMHRKGAQPATALGLVIGGLMMAAAYLKGEQAIVFFIALSLLLSFLWYVSAAPKARQNALGNIGGTLLGLIWVPFLASFVMLLLTQPSGRALTLAVLGLTFLYDAAAFVVGSFWGSRALAPAISPKKSWEGLFAATVVTFAVSIALLPSIEPLTWGRSVGIGLVIALFAPLGDLFESFVKRDLSVKDMGSVLPGHGGIMDRIDSALFVLPAVFYFLRLIF